MANENSFTRRISLPLPHQRNDPPNAPMINRSQVRITLTEHQRQRDQETATAEEREKQLNQQRRSLMAATEEVEHLHRIDSSTGKHQFLCNVSSKKVFEPQKSIQK
ncbi:unnamed protein product [Adineta ricciae]|uniref:Uncharacterized protein n=1 Tax=Adineta ricciae TaxID=249248 RepID=A0A813S4G3_ADIRI|nr:unnamed protein product [Adineta ricciae]CAF1252308.1 unnamed protein product [Adineta ricciae]